MAHAKIRLRAGTRTGSLVGTNVGGFYNPQSGLPNYLAATRAKSHERQSGNDYERPVPSLVGLVPARLQFSSGLVPDIIFLAQGNAKPLHNK